MSRLAAFFQDTDTKFGIFYPEHHLLSAFPNFEDAESAKKALMTSGWDSADIISVPGEEVVYFAEEYLLKHGLWGLLMTQLSRAIGTEAPYADADLAAAKKGAAFLAVHCPTDEDKAAAWKVLKPTHPLVARYYSGSGIEHLAGEYQTGQN
jgi:hypothetical protein